MSYTRIDFARGLLQQVSHGYDVVRVARWAHVEYITHCKSIDYELMMIMMKVIAMEEGPQFEMSENEMIELIEALKKP